MSRYSLVEGSKIKSSQIAEFKSKASSLLSVKSQTSYFALKDGFPIGCIEITLVDQAAILLNLHVDLNHKSRGVENGLVLKAESYARENNCSKLYFLVHENDTALLSDFLKRRGYRLLEGHGALLGINDLKNAVIYSKI